MRQTQLNKIWVERINPETGANEKIEIHEESEMAKVILRRNKTHLRQAQMTPFADSELGKLLKLDGSGTMVEDILHGTVEQTQEI